ncbi:MAG: cyclic nucleotide-binding domain-containing protein [Hyphomicrobiaceae bacterium]
MTQDPRVRDLLNEIPLFAGCSPEVLAGIAVTAKARDCAKGEVIYNSGEQAREMFILLNGLVSFTTPTGVGLLHVERLMKRHMIFGWAALVPEHPQRLGTARCLEASRLIELDGDKVMEVLAATPASGFLVMTRLCSMIANTFMTKA